MTLDNAGWSLLDRGGRPQTTTGCSTAADDDDGTSGPSGLEDSV